MIISYKAAASVLRGGVFKSSAQASWATAELEDDRAAARKVEANYRSARHRTLISLLQKRHWEERDRQRKDRERQARVEGYRITFLQRQIERKREVDGLADLIALWEQEKNPDPKFAQLLEFAQLYREWLDARIAPVAITERLAELRLMDDDVHIYDPKRLD